MKTFLKNFARHESGASAAEYALILVIIGLGLVVAAETLEGAISGAMNTTATEINEAHGAGGS